jgi:hypothetical protein
LLSQPQPASSPTDRQLQAAYCLGVVQESLVPLGKEKDKPPVPPRSLEEILADLKARYTQSQPSPGDLLSEAKSRYQTEILYYDIWAGNRSGFEEVERRRQKIYTYLVTTGAFDYLVTVPAAPSGIDVARRQGVADRKQCDATISSGCGGIKERMSKDEMWDQFACSDKLLFNTPACVGVQRCTWIEAHLPSGSDAKP